MRGDEIGSVERFLHFHEIGPGGSPRYLVPVIQRVLGAVLIVTKDPDRLVAHDVHAVSSMLP